MLVRAACKLANSCYPCLTVCLSCSPATSLSCSSCCKPAACNQSGPGGQFLNSLFISAKIHPLQGAESIFTWHHMKESKKCRALVSWCQPIRAQFWDVTSIVIPSMGLTNMTMPFFINFIAEFALILTIGHKVLYKLYWLVGVSQSELNHGMSYPS